MKWLLGIYTSRYNRRHKEFGHLFSGRYKALIVDGSGKRYLKTVCDYVHLNPARAKVLKPGQALSAFAWSSYPQYLGASSRRPKWLRVDRLLGEWGIPKDSEAGRRALSPRAVADQGCRTSLQPPATACHTCPFEFQHFSFSNSSPWKNSSAPSSSTSWSSRRSHPAPTFSQFCSILRLTPASRFDKHKENRWKTSATMKKQFSLTRAAPSTCGRPKTNFLSF